MVKFIYSYPFPIYTIIKIKYEKVRIFNMKEAIAYEN